MKAVRDIMLRFGFVSTLLLTLVFAAPAFESHACAIEAPFAGAEVTAGETSDTLQCPDCGPACANGCCHAPHSAVSPDISTPRFLLVFGHPEAWSDAVERALDRPDGLDRPPRA